MKLRSVFLSLLYVLWASCTFAAFQPLNVQQMGAKCDVQVFGSAVWDGTHFVLPGKGLAATLKPGQFLTAPGITAGPQTLTRWWTLTNRGNNYRQGDVLTFIGDSASGAYTQRLTMVVDSTSVTNSASDATTGPGPIFRMRPLFGGIYQTLPTGSTPGVLVQDTTPGYSYTAAGSGATITPTWSGWSAMDKRGLDIVSGRGGTGYTVGDVVTFNDGTANQGQKVKILVEAVDGSGAILPAAGNGQAGFDFLNYGSYATIPNAGGNLTASTGGTGTGAVLGNPNGQQIWQFDTLATTIAAVVASGGNTLITPTDAPIGAFTGQPVTILAVGSDDGAAINNALQNSNGLDVKIPGNCGTTVPIIAPNQTSLTAKNSSLVGNGMLSTGIYAFAYDLADRAAHPLMNHLYYKDVLSSSGGGANNLTLNGLGVAQGYGYYGGGPAPGAGLPAPPGYTPPSGIGTNVVPTTGSVVEIDGARLISFNQVYIQNAQGTGNAGYQCGVDEGYPNVAGIQGSVGNIYFTNSRIDTNQYLAGARNPDYGMLLENDCHDSFYTNISSFDGNLADILSWRGNNFNTMHTNSDTFPSLPLGIPGLTSPMQFPGVANYGIYNPGHSSITSTQNDGANFAGIFQAVDDRLSENNPGIIIGTQMKCGPSATVVPGYVGVELANGASGVSLTGTTASGRCNVPPAQIIKLDGTIDTTVAICNNSGATVYTCAQRITPSGGDDGPQIAALWALGQSVIPNPGTYQVCNLSVPTGGIIDGPGARTANAGTYLTAGMLVKFIPTAACTNNPMFNVSTTQGYKIAGIMIDCQHLTGVDGISGGGQQQILDDLQVTRCVNGFGDSLGNGEFNSATGTRLYMFHNGTAIYYPIDSSFSHMKVGSNTLGAYLGPNSYSTTFDDFTFEFNTTYDFDCDGCRRVIWSGGKTDSSFKNAFYFHNQAHHDLLSGVRLYRGASNATGTDDSALYIDGAHDITAYVDSQEGMNDDGSGATRPLYVARFGTDGANTTIKIGGNLQGSANAVFTGTIPPATAIDNVADALFGIVTGTTAPTQTTSFTFGSTTQAWPCDATSGNQVGTVPQGSASTPSQFVANRTYTLVKVDSTANTCAATLHSGDTFVGYPTSTITLRNKGDAVTFQNEAGGTAWHVLSMVSGGGRSGTPIMGGSIAQQAAGTTQYFPISGSINQALTTDASAQQPIYVPGVISGIIGNVQNAPGGTDTVTFTFRLNGATPTNAPTCTITGVAKNCTDTNPAHVVPVAFNDTVDEQVIFTATAATSRHDFSMRFDGQ